MTSLEKRYEEEISKKQEATADLKKEKEKYQLLQTDLRIESKQYLEILEKRYQEMCNSFKKDLEYKCNKIINEEKEKVQTYQNYFNCLSRDLREKSNLSMIPFVAGMISDIETIGIEKAAEALDLGDNKVRKEKACSLRELRAKTKKQLEEAKVSYYQLQYLLQLFPSLQDLLDAKYDEVKMDLTSFNPNNQDPIRHFLSKEEWENLSETDRNQLALDRYVQSHHKNNWQIGRDYELYIGQKYLYKGYSVDFTGSYMGLNDMGRDLICKKEGKTLIIQCKYWSKDKQIHENHINQLYGTMISYAIENNLPNNLVNGCFITNTSLSNTASEFAKRLNIEIYQNVAIDDFPRIKCNIGKDCNGKETKIYHLPMDLSYDVTQIKNKGEFFAKTVAEAEKAGFRRSYKWSQTND